MNTDLCWSYDHCYERLQTLCTSHPGRAHLSSCGKTVEGRDIPKLEIGSGEPALGLLGLVHAREAGPELIVPVLESLLRDEPKLLERCRIIAVPMVSIDNCERILKEGLPYQRKNAAGVDLNRNFPADWETVTYSHGLNSSDPDSMTFRGPAAGSEPETQAVMTALEDAGLRCVFSFHWHPPLCALPALSYEGAQEDEVYMSECRRWVEAYSRGLYPDRNYEDWFHGAQTSAGSLAAWCYRERRLPAFDLEGGSVSMKYGTKDHEPFDQELLVDYRVRHVRAVRNVLALLA